MPLTIGNSRVKWGLSQEYWLRNPHCVLMSQIIFSQYLSILCTNSGSFLTKMMTFHVPWASFSAGLECQGLCFHSFMLPTTPDLYSPSCRWSCHQKLAIFQICPVGWGPSNSHLGEGYWGPCFLLSIRLLRITLSGQSTISVDVEANFLAREYFE